MKYEWTIFCPLMIWCSFQVDADQTFRELTGEYQIIGGVSEGRILLGQSHFWVALTGKSAADLYRSMPVKAVRDVCLDDGSLTKFLKNMQCTKLTKAGGYRCSFSIDIKNQSIEIGASC